MQTRYRTLLLAGAASLAMSAAVAQVTTNGVPSTISQIVQVVWNGQNISAGNPLPVNIVSGGSSAGSVTAAGTNGTQAQAVQGITGGVPAPTGGESAPGCGMRAGPARARAAAWRTVNVRVQKLQLGRVVALRADEERLLRRCRHAVGAGGRRGRAAE